MKLDYCIIGTGRFGTQLAEQLKSLNKDVMIIDNDADNVNLISKRFDTVIKADATDLVSLKDSGVQYIKNVIVCISNIEASIMVCSNLKELGVQKITARGKNFIHERILKNMNVLNIIIPEIESANRLASRLVYNEGAEITSLSENLCNVKTIIGNKDLNGRSVFDLKLKDKYEANIIIIKRDDKVIFPITKDTVLKFKDEVSLVTSKDNVKKIISFFKK